MLGCAQAGPARLDPAQCFWLCSWRDPTCCVEPVNWGLWAPSAGLRQCGRWCSWWDVQGWGRGKLLEGRWGNPAGEALLPGGLYHRDNLDHLWREKIRMHSWYISSLIELRYRFCFVAFAAVLCKEFATCLIRILLWRQVPCLSAGVLRSLDVRSDGIWARLVCPKDKLGSSSGLAFLDLMRDGMQITPNEC